MRWYDERVLPRLIDLTCGSRQMDPLRERVCAGLTGDVVEIGFGSGRNITHYPSTVRRVDAVEPSDLAWHLAGRRVDSSAVDVRRAGLDGQRLPLPDGGYDCALSTWSLCTIPDAPHALAELRRVLKPCGALHFLEHGLAPDDRVRRWQHRLEPMQRRMAGGCHLTRPVVEMLTDAGFVVDTVDVFYAHGTPKFAGAFSLGVAVSP
ncbi:class I SAM-dependent methyltransferase [Rhodococcus sp. D2-41]|uniref:Class I SAM-dependent methyltransferase n=1 Tax=Speluncibacter jeojiensis TaxID=2710754 RepID=A0A9X4M4N2_9ACTN|nr:class I SAM-dependent methyltransferase [Rhodococcus sp. D2-41]MDG3009283.1 class I SAM-dependent methyltransferase [Rhodococcus sp. D2-41]MDG3016930.1 class I SAM-dependent methyltransferase [Corynebacteriales bacterium D3-21]